MELLHPIRMPRSSMLIEERLGDKVELAARKLLQRMTDSSDRSFVLILLDADDDLACQIGPRLASYAMQRRADIESACVVAVREYETWFAASAESLRDAGYLLNPLISEQPEVDRMAKGWLKKCFHGSYSETADQPKLTAWLDLQLARRRSPSFDKLRRVLESLDVEPG